MKARLPTLLCLALLAVGTCHAVPAHAVSVYDVIQLSRSGYDEGEIVGILDATNSAFALSADDVIRLKRLGVGERVIRRMLVATPEGRPEWRPVERDTAPAAPRAREGGAAGARYHHDAYDQTDAHSVVRRPAEGAEEER